MSGRKASHTQTLDNVSVYAYWHSIMGFLTHYSETRKKMVYQTLDLMVTLIVV